MGSHPLADWRGGADDEGRGQEGWRSILTTADRAGEHEREWEDGDGASQRDVASEGKSRRIGEGRCLTGTNIYMALPGMERATI